MIVPRRKDKLATSDGESERRLRDRFAIAALAACEPMAEGDHMMGYWHSPEKIAKRCYALADAMLIEREQ